MNTIGWKASHLGWLQHKQRARCHNADHMGDDVCICTIRLIHNVWWSRQQNNLVQNNNRWRHEQTEACHCQSHQLYIVQQIHVLGSTIVYGQWWQYLQALGRGDGSTNTDVSRPSVRYYVHWHITVRSRKYFFIWGTFWFFKYLI